MSDATELPSARQILQSDAATAAGAARLPQAANDLPDDDDFRRVITALRIVLRMRGS